VHTVGLDRARETEQSKPYLSTRASVDMKSVLPCSRSAQGSLDSQLFQPLSKADPNANTGPAHTTQCILYRWQDGRCAFATSLVIALCALLFPPPTIRAAGVVVAWGGNTYGIKSVLPDLTNIVAIAAGGADSLALSSDGRVLVWGAPGALTNMPAGLTNAQAVAAGEGHCLALKNDGTVLAWGQNDHLQASVPAGLTNVIAIATGKYHNLALQREGRVVAWGDNSNGQTDVPADLTNVVAISGGPAYSLALKADGTVVGWGYFEGQSTFPQAFSQIVAVAAGEYRILAIRQDGSLVTWPAYEPSPNISNVVAVAAGFFDINLVLSGDGTVGHWYDAFYFVDPGSPPAGLTNVIAISTKGGPPDGLALIGDSPPSLDVHVLKPTATRSTFSFSLPTRSGRVYAVEFKRSLADLTWTNLPLLAGDGQIRTLTYEIAADAQRFYRVRQW
jgi:hypothetical protein